MCSGCFHDTNGRYDRELAHIAARKKEADEPITDALGQDVSQNVLEFAIRMKDLQTALGISYARYLVNTSALIQQRGLTFPSPLVGKRRVA